MTDRPPAHCTRSLRSNPRPGTLDVERRRRWRRPAMWTRAIAPLLLTCLIVFGLKSAPAQDAVPGLADDTESARAASGFVVGINGHYRVGRLTAVRVDQSFLARPQGGQAGEDGSTGSLRMQTIDGDGVRVSYDPFPFRVPDANGRELGYVVPGSEAAPLTLIESAGSEAAVLLSARFPLRGIPSQGPSMIPSATPWVLAIGDSLGVDSIGSSSILLNKEARLAVTQVDAATSLPHHTFGYDGVDLVMITARGIPVLRGMTGEQRDALSSWLRSGGRLFVCLGRSTEELVEAAPWLRQALPIEEIEVSRYDPAAFEMFASSQNRLEEFRGIKLPKREGRTIVSGRTTRRVTAIQAAEYVVGFGRVTVVSADLDNQSFAAWPERLRFVTQIVGELFDDPSNDKDRTDGSTSFRDLAGQMRGSLDQFAVKTQFSFSLVSLIVMLLIAAIGPLDYLLINRVWGKPLLGWVSFPLIAIALSAFLVVQAAPRQDSEGGADETEGGSSEALLRANQFQVVDIDLVDQVGRGFAWCSIYSHDPTRLDVMYSSDAPLQPIRDSERAFSQSFTFPMGYPGREFGGLQLATENSVFPDYSVAPQRKAAEASPIVSPVRGVTVAPRSSKSLASRILFTPKFDRDYSLARRPGSELLRGEFVNPLPYDLLDGMIIYGNWAYILPTRVPAGAGVPQLNELIQKNFRWRLTGQQMGDNASAESTAWSPGNFDDPRRVADMVMFHQAAGGSIYTGLNHDSLGHLDLSTILDEGRCILVGRTEVPLFDLEIGQAGQEETPDVKARPGNTLSIVRVVLPVRSTRLK